MLSLLCKKNPRAALSSRILSLSSSNTSTNASTNRESNERGAFGAYRIFWRTLLSAHGDLALRVQTSQHVYARPSLLACAHVCARAWAFCFCAA